MTDTIPDLPALPGSMPFVHNVDNQTTLTLGVQSIGMTLLKTNTEGLAKLAKIFALHRGDAGLGHRRAERAYQSNNNGHWCHRR